MVADYAPSDTIEPFTIAAFSELQDDTNDLELIEGEIVRMPPPKQRHSRVIGKLLESLILFVKEHELGFVSNSGGMVLPGWRETLVEPDMYFIAAGRLVNDWDAPGYIEPIPDLVVKVLSPYDLATKVQAKIDLYLTAGVQLLWLVDPERRVVNVWTSDRRMMTLTIETTLDGGDLLVGFSLPLTTLFS